MVFVVLLAVHTSASAASHPGVVGDELQEAINRATSPARWHRGRTTP
jgi:hypothetical protein